MQVYGGQTHHRYLLGLLQYLTAMNPPDLYS